MSNPGATALDYSLATERSGATEEAGVETRTITLAPLPALLSLVLLGLIFRQPRVAGRYRFGAGRASERVSG